MSRIVILFFVTAYGCAIGSRWKFWLVLPAALCTVTGILAGLVCRTNLIRLFTAALGFLLIVLLSWGGEGR